MNLFVGILFLLFVGQLRAEQSSACQIKVTHDNNPYFHQLLELILDKTKQEFGDCQLILKPRPVSGRRLMRELASGELDIIWRSYEDLDEYRITPIKHPLFKELSDYRILLINKKDQTSFNSVKSVADLRKLRGGVGSHWADRKVMEKNHLNFMVSVSYENLFKMLIAKRFDYFPRGIYQALPEMHRYEAQGVVIEQALLLQYPNPHYFYVASSNSVAHERMEKGFKMALEDGSFEQLFQQFEQLRWAENLLQTHKRQIIKLDL